LQEDAKEALKKATHPLNKEKKAEDHAQAEAAKAQASLKKEEQHMQSVGGRQVGSEAVTEFCQRPQSRHHLRWSYDLHHQLCPAPVYGFPYLFSAHAIIN
jgi:hypothetical protein